MNSLINLLYSTYRNIRQLIRQWVIIDFQTPKRKKKIKLTPEIKNLESKLINLLQGDRNTAIRLIKQQNQLNRGRSYQWCLEKVIHDIERDRRL